MDYYDDNMSIASMAINDAESGEGGSLNSRSKSGFNDDDSDEDSAILEVKERTRGVGWYRTVMILLLFCSGIGLAVAAYLTTGDSEPNDGQNDGGIIASAVVIVFFVLIAVFLRYDYLINRRQSMLLDMAKRSRNIVDQLFPSTVRDRLLRDASGRRPSNSSGHDEDNNNVAATLTDKDIARLTKMNTMANKNISESAPIPVQDVLSPTQPSSSTTTPFATVKSYLADGNNKEIRDVQSQPIADLFLDTTVLFADIAGFTAWSSQRDPPAVFKLLETVYSEFDTLAGKQRVFKVETIGDSYMAVTGLPEPNEDHAICMARFAYQCLLRMKAVTQELESLLGPGTNELSVRIGLHSGPVTAGVLRGQKSRFQLFGDTVNTASRMESTGKPDKIQISQESATLLIKAGKPHWVKERHDVIVAKGKGEMKTYWLDPNRKQNSNNESSEVGEAVPQNSYHESGRQQQQVIAATNNPVHVPESAPPINEMPSPAPAAAPQPRPPALDRNRSTGTATHVSSGSTAMSDERLARLVDWNTDVLLNHLSNVMSHRHSGVGGTRSVKPVDHRTETSELPPAFDLVAEVIILPEYDPYQQGRHQNADLDPDMLSTLRDDLRAFVKEIADTYDPEVPFHNFEHASHVALAANKLISRMTVAEDGMDEIGLHNMTFGISSDPLTHFTIVLAALIHDAGHQGVTNAQLVKEEAEIAIRFKNRSVAEQNSFHVAWEILMEPRFEFLRSCIYKTNVERKRFRQVLINSIMATDIANREVNQLRIKKFDKAFKEEDNRGSDDLMTRDEINRKATVVIEGLIQVADVAHTMQHWNIYQKWNRRLLTEMLVAYRDERASFDPRENWFNGEIGFYDFYIIPLAKKMSGSGVFGKAGEQYVAYATSNRNEWEQRGKEALSGTLAELEALLEEDDGNSADNDSILGDDENSVMADSLQPVVC